MPNFGENTRGFIEFPIYYYDVVYSQSLPVRGYAGCASVLVNAWDAIAVAPALLNVDAAGALKVTGGGVAGGLTDTELRATPVPVSGPVTDTQLRATPVPVSGTVAVTGTFYQTTQPVSLATLPNPSNLDVPLSVLVANQMIENVLQAQQLAVMRAGPAGFVPMETPGFLAGFG